MQRCSLVRCGDLHPGLYHVRREDHYPEDHPAHGPRNHRPEQAYIVFGLVGLAEEFPRAFVPAEEEEVAGHLSDQRRSQALEHGSKAIVSDNVFG